MSTNIGQSCKQAQCLLDKRNCRRQMQRWNKSLLVVLGFEQICQRLQVQTAWQRRLAVAPESDNRAQADHSAAAKGPLDIICERPDWSSAGHLSSRRDNQAPMDQSDDWSTSTRSSCSPNIAQDASPQAMTDQFLQVYAEWCQSAAATQQLWSMIPVYMSAQQGNVFIPVASGQHSARSGLLDGFAQPKAVLPAAADDESPPRPPPPCLLEEEDSDQPLDLSLKREKALKRPAANAAAEESSVVSSIGKRSYSKADLEAAVLDIRSGRLGTRRASVVYGVPRSTLRNKIHKLEASSVNSAPTMKGAQQKVPVPTAASPGRTKRAHASPKSARNLDTTLRNVALQVCARQLSTALACRRHKVAAVSEPPPGETCALDANHRTTLLASASVQQALRAAATGAVVQAVHEVANAKELANVGVDTAARDRAHSAGLADAEAASCSSESSAVNSAAALSLHDEAASAKKLRRKRGQYRKYDKSALALAVQSVRKGEMSVHKAGSFYGVPHSTLEYKVKERNLLRAKKQLDTGSGRVRLPLDKLATSLRQNEYAASNTVPTELGNNTSEADEAAFSNLCTLAKSDIVEKADNSWRKIRRKKMTPTKIVAHKNDTFENECAAYLTLDENSN